MSLISYSLPASCYRGAEWISSGCLVRVAASSAAAVALFRYCTFVLGYCCPLFVPLCLVSASSLASHILRSFFSALPIAQRAGVSSSRSLLGPVARLSIRLPTHSPARRVTSPRVSLFSAHVFLSLSSLECRRLPDFQTTGRRQSSQLRPAPL